MPRKWHTCVFGMGGKGEIKNEKIEELERGENVKNSQKNEPEIRQVQLNSPAQTYEIIAHAWGYN